MWIYCVPSLRWTDRDLAIQQWVLATMAIALVLHELRPGGACRVSSPSRHGDMTLSRSGSGVARSTDRRDTQSEDRSEFGRDGSGGR